MSKPRFARAAIGLLASSMLVREAPNGPSEEERRQPMAGYQGTRLASFTASSYRAESHTVEAVLSTGAPVRRFFFTEELVIEPGAVDLSRAEAGQVKLLDTHNQYEASGVIGTVSNVRIEGNQLLGTLKFGQTERAIEIEGMVSRGELTGVSIGYKVNTWEIVRTDPETDFETWRAAAWELLEVSLVPVPADANAGVRSNGGSSAPSANEEEDPMKRNNPGSEPAVTPAPEPVRSAEPAPAPAPAPAVEPVRAAEPAPAPSPAPAAAITRFSGAEAVAFVEQARSLGVETRANELVQQNERGEIGVETARQALLTAAAERQRAETAPARSAPATVTRDEQETSRDAIAGMIVARVLRQDVPEASRPYVGMRLLEIAATRAGISPRERDASVILRAANTSSDFPLLLEAAANKILLARYNSAKPTYQAIAARRDLTDFKTTKLLRVGDFPTLVAYQEDGEIKAGTINEGRETVILGSYGRILRMSRQAIVNDDLGAFDQVFGSIGLVVSRFENATFFAMKAANSGNGPKLSDNVNFFNSAHGNLAGSGAAPSVATLGAARAAMRKQKDLDGNALNIAPSIILTGPDIETETQQLLAPIQAQQAGNVNPFAGTLQHEVDAAIAGNAWELYASPAELPAFSYGYLVDAPGPRVMTEEPFNVDGIALRVTLDFYSGAVDYRGGYRNPGA